MNSDVLISVHGYLGDAQQIRDFLPLFEHHNRPIVIVSPDDSQIHNVGPHICRTAGLRAYIGQVSWDRQWKQMKMLLEYPFSHILMNDADSFAFCAELPNYLFEDDNVLYSNLVDDFRRPGETWTDASGSITWPMDYHAGMPLKAAQPPYFCSRKVIEKLVKVGPGEACPITPFIDFMMIAQPTKAGVELRPFKLCASCETVTPHGIAVMTQRIVRDGVQFIHSVKTKETMERLWAIYRGRA